MSSEMIKNQHILVTGGAGFIGSHTVLVLLEAGYTVTVVDNLSNAYQESLNRVSELTGKSVNFYQVDVTDKAALNSVFAQHQFDAVIHFAGLKSVNESVAQPLHYYFNNVQGTINLCEVMAQHNVHQLVFSSSATVYGEPEALPLDEAMPVGQPTNPYGQSKLMVEKILQDLHFSDDKWQIALLRYFNPVGAHESGLIGEDPNGIPNNLMPYISQVASGRLAELSVFGDDYETNDGTGVRDFIHVMDLAEGHAKALAHLDSQPGVATVNLGTGEGYSVLQLVNTFEQVNNVKVPYKIAPRRPGDLAAVYADVAKAKSVLQWQASRNIEDMCRDTWHWQSKNPHGFAGR